MPDLAHLTRLYTLTLAMIDRCRTLDELRAVELFVFARSKSA